ncbi:uncharacterized protein LOC18437607 isoform X2 [Amborella trichopoda]|uniref:uncharacterized protein LOC18437607 isoform X2 n=1 Tax=Amborella trichopoda TaxID=13333 RepID=UPI0009C0FCB7|nr:uncharacterized protein LOC18437607 isoform X2 [Amborella trichopoda]|eukprot:XP_020524944.1 uncharacterized protein LOC18437607 isoform X2 [Amborella trichopoda]
MGEDTETTTSPEPHKRINWASDLLEIKRNSGDGLLISGNFSLFEEIENRQKGFINSHFLANSSDSMLEFSGHQLLDSSSRSIAREEGLSLRPYLQFFPASVNQNGSFSSEIPVLFPVIKEEGHVPSMSQDQNGDQLVLFNHTPLWCERQENEFFRQISGDQVAGKLMEEAADSDKNQKCIMEAATKRPRMDAPSSQFSTFKVRKEKLGDRITALQQLVSPFGKVLSHPYMRLNHGRTPERARDLEEKGQDLRSRGMCLVPVSTTLSVAKEIRPDF